MKYVKKISKIILVLLIVMLNGKLVLAETIKADIIPDTEVELYDEDKNIVAYYYKLGTGGYIILNSEKDDFIEYSKDSDRLELSNDKTYYYGGPIKVYEEVFNETVRNCRTKEICAKEKIKGSNIGKINKGTSLSSSSLVSVSPYVVSTIESDELPYTTSLYDYNPDGRCGAVAASILLKYYDLHVSSNYVSSRNTTSDGVNLINVMYNYIGAGSTYETLSYGIKRYVASRGFASSTVGYSYGINSQGVYYMIKRYIGLDRPVIVGLTSHPKYGEHWVVGTGYRIVYSKAYGYGYVVVVNDGWGDSGIGINLMYVDGCIYIDD